MIKNDINSYSNDNKDTNLSPSKKNKGPTSEPKGPEVQQPIKGKDKAGGIKPRPNLQTWGPSLLAQTLSSLKQRSRLVAASPRGGARLGAPQTWHQPWPFAWLRAFHHSSHLGRVGRAQARTQFLNKDHLFRQKAAPELKEQHVQLERGLGCGVILLRRVSLQGSRSQHRRLQ